MLVVCLVVLGSLVWVGPASAQSTDLVLDSQPGDYIGQGRRQTLTTADGTFSARRNYDNGVSVTFLSQPGNVLWSLDFAAPGNQLLAPGAYLNATRFPFQASTAPGLSVSGDGRGCNTLTGRFTVLEVVYGAGDAITSFAATFEQHCEGFAPALFGTIRVNAFDATAPGEPTALAALVEAGTAHFVWLPPTTGGAPLTYRLEGGLSYGTTIATFSTTSATPTFDLAGVPPGRFYFRVRGVNLVGAGPASEEVVLTVSPAGMSPPGPPGNVAATIVGDQLSMSWSAPSPLGALDTYVLEAGSVSGASNIAVLSVGPNTSFSYAGVPPGVYFLRVRGQNAAGAGPASAEALLVAGGVPAPPGPPRMLNGSVSGSTVTLDWMIPASGDPATRYRIEAGSRPGLSDLAVADSPTAATAIGFTGVPPGRYYVRVRGLNTNGAGPVSNEVRITVP
jgi:hypothetical protein